MAGWATPAINAPDQDELKYLRQCYEVFKRTSTIPSTDEEEKGVSVNDSSPSLSPSSVRVNERAGTSLILQRMRIIFDIKGMVDEHLFYSLEMIRAFFMVPTLSADFVNSPLIKWIIGKMYQQLRQGKQRHVDNPAFQITIRGLA